MLTGEASRPRGADLALAGVCALAGALALAAPAAALEQTLTATDGATDDTFGEAVAIDGDTLVVGATSSDGDKGAVYVYQRSGDVWTQTAKLSASDGATSDSLGSSVAIDGDTIVVGAPSDDVGANTSQGSVYTFARTGAAARTETAKLTASDGAALDNLGRSVAIDGDTIIAGASGDDVGADVDEGSVYTFSRTGAANRTQASKLVAGAGSGGDRLGTSVAIDGDTIVAGATGFDRPGSTDKGAAYTFPRTGGGEISPTALLEASDAAAGDKLGKSVAIDGDTIVAGAYNDDVNANTDQGSAYTFARTGATPRTETAKLTPSDGAANDRLGDSVAIDGDTIVAGADGSGAEQGSAYTFARSGGAVRTQTAKLTAAAGSPGDDLGISVAIDGDTIASGAFLDDIGAGIDQGSAEVFFTPALPPPSPGDTTAPDTTGLKGPKKVERGKKAKFRFGSSESGSSFLCQVDAKKFKPCSSPAKVKTKRLKPGRHSFAATAVDAAGNADVSPAKVRFKVVRRLTARSELGAAQESLSCIWGSFSE